MGKNYPCIKTLKEKPLCFEETLKLIEASFHYRPGFSYKTDFAPLMDPSNHHNCYLLLEENDKVIAHIGVKERFLRVGNTSYPVCMLGGVAVDEAYRGQGHFQTLIQEVLADKRSDTSLFLLWSDQEKLYKRYGFYLCGNQFEITAAESQKEAFKKTTYQQLNQHQKTKIQKLYANSFQSYYSSLNRSEQDWELISQVSSADLFIRERDNSLSDYFFKGKGQDLTDIIHEYGTSQEMESFLKEISSEGKLWTGRALALEVEQSLYQFLMAPGDPKLFSQLVKAYTNELIVIRDVNPMKQEVYFDFNQETLALEVEGFLRGVFGPGPFEELGDMKPLYIAGLDSI